MVLSFYNNMVLYNVTNLTIIITVMQKIIYYLNDLYSK